MNDNQFMGLRIRFGGGGFTNIARQSIRGASDSDGGGRMNSSRQSIHGALNKI